METRSMNTITVTGHWAEAPQVPTPQPEVPADPAEPTEVENPDPPETDDAPRES
jgi:hypothetical protein